MDKSLASWKMNVNLARIQSVIIKQTFEELSLIRSGSIYGSCRLQLKKILLVLPVCQTFLSVFVLNCGCRTGWNWDWRGQ